MMTEMLEELAQRLGGPRNVNVIIHVEDGAELALKTWNPRLGIEGGISILGTSGVVRPYSCSAWIASIHRGIDVARANGVCHGLASTGFTSESYLRQQFLVEDIACLDMGDFIGGVLKYLRHHPLPRLSIAGGVAKMVKFAQGAADLHSARSQVDFDVLADWAEEVGIARDIVLNANTVLEVVSTASENQRKDLAKLIARRGLEKARHLLANTPIELDIAIISREGNCLAIENSRPM